MLLLSQCIKHRRASFFILGRYLIYLWDFPFSDTLCDDMAASSMLYKILMVTMSSICSV